MLKSQEMPKASRKPTPPRVSPAVTAPVESRDGGKTKCFVIMPVSTPKGVIDQYGGDSDHFAHVLDHLFFPAIESVGFAPLAPRAAGSDLIQAGIIKQLEEADLVLCDMSTLNANVFFELGIRTALDRPVCLVRDDKTGGVPFDTGVINHHVYDSSLSAWVLEKEKEALANHLLASLNRSERQNTMWKYFGVTTRAHAATQGVGQGDKLDVIIELLQSATPSLGRDIPKLGPNPSAPEVQHWIFQQASELAKQMGAKLTLAEADTEKVVLDLGSSVIPGHLARRIEALGEEHGIQVTIQGELFV